MLMTFPAVMFTLLPLQTRPAPATNSMQADVNRLVRAAEGLEGTWPSGPPPPTAEVAVVARHGVAVVPVLMDLLSDDTNAEKDRKRWKVRQQAALALCRIYSQPQHCGRTFCDGDRTERIGGVKEGWQRTIASNAELQALSTRELLDRFKQEKMFWRQFEFGRALAAANDSSVIAELEGWLTHEYRQVRGNVAYVLGRLGDPRGFEAIAQIVADRSPRPIRQGMPGGMAVPGQIRADQYYAAHLLGDLKDPRGVELLISLLNDPAVSYFAPWSLAEIGDPRAIGPLIGQLERDDPSIRVLTILALEMLSAREALPKLQELLSDSRKATFGDGTTVSDAAKHAIAAISQLPSPDPRP